MKRQLTQSERIEANSKKLIKATKLLNDLSKALDQLERANSLIDELIDYSQSEGFMEDFEADEEGLIANTVNRAVLSEDGISDLLELRNEVMEKLNELVD